MRHTNEYNKLRAFSAAVSIRMLGFPILAAPGSVSLFCSTSHLLDFTSMFAATVTPHPKTKTQPCKNSCGLWDGGEFCLNSKSLWRHFVYEYNQKNGKPDPVFISKLKFQILTWSEETDTTGQFDAWAHFRGNQQRVRPIQTCILRVYIFVISSELSIFDEQ